MGLPYAEVIGEPISHSKSPLIHNHWLGQLGMDAEYRATHVQSRDLSQFLRERRSDPDWLGCNVTIPHKQAAVPFVDRCSKDARAIGAVNCIVPRGDALIGDNSDVDGIAAALDAIALERRSVAVIGGGGAARAALAYLARRHVQAINFVVRDPPKAGGLKQIVPEAIVRIGSFEDASHLLDGAAAIINASPLGMTGCPQMPLDLLAAISRQPDAVLFDMVYDPVATSFLSSGQSQRIDGLLMLVGQAARAFELFFGEAPPASDPHIRTLLIGASSAS